MAQSWSFGRKIGTGFAVCVGLAVVMGLVSVLALRSVVADKDLVITKHAQDVIDAERLRGAFEARSSSVRAFLLTREDRFVSEMRARESRILKMFGDLRARAGSEEGRGLVESIAKASRDHQESADRVIVLRKGETAGDGAVQRFEDEVVPLYRVLESALDSFVSREQGQLEEGKQLASETSSTASALLVGLAVAAVVLGIFIAVALTRAVVRQVSSAVQHVQSSSAELQSAANQQAAGAKE